MKYLIISFLLILLFGCGNKNEVYWCGDNACVNKKEKEEYFKKTMIVEKRKINKENEKIESEFDLIIDQSAQEEKISNKGEKKLAKQVRLDEKRRIKEQKKLDKQLRAEEKERIKAKRKMEKEKRTKEKKILKAKKKSSSNEAKSIDDPLIGDNTATNSDTSLSIKNFEFESFVEKITRKNKTKPYPDINDIPN